MMLLLVMHTPGRFRKAKSSEKSRKVRELDPAPCCYRYVGIEFPDSRGKTRPIVNPDVCVQKSESKYRTVVDEWDWGYTCPALFCSCALQQNHKDTLNDHGTWFLDKFMFMREGFTGLRSKQATPKTLGTSSAVRLSYSCPVRSTVLHCRSHTPVSPP